MHLARSPSRVNGASQARLKSRSDPACHRVSAELAPKNSVCRLHSRSPGVG
jgi:hypothetical protein